MRLQEAVLEDESAPMRVLELASVVDGHLATIVCGSDSGADTSKGLIINPSGVVMSSIDGSCQVVLALVFLSLAILLLIFSSCVYPTASLGIMHSKALRLCVVFTTGSCSAFQHTDNFRLRFSEQIRLCSRLLLAGTEWSKHCHCSRVQNVQ